ncbi:MAG: type 1 glutamine amidotransferase domain-containing protein [Rhodospirillales bacterium]|nr:type 1 glutamine amidotransferase domain-containing protein [Rhodospirillales bacterium]
MASSNTVLFVVTSHALIGGTGRPTGFYFEEMATPYWACEDAGYQVEIASIKGGKPPYDPNSVKPEGDNSPAVARFLANAGAMGKLENTRPVSALKADDYIGIFLPGGHGTVWDFPFSTDLARLVGDLFNTGKAVGAVCHGPSGLVKARRTDGKSILHGRKVNSFTDAEEMAIGLDGVVPTLLESGIRALGGDFQSSPNFQSHAIRDGNLVTGQNPASSEPVARLLVETLGDVARAARQS